MLLFKTLRGVIFHLVIFFVIPAIATSSYNSSCPLDSQIYRTAVENSPVDQDEVGWSMARAGNMLAVGVDDRNGDIGAVEMSSISSNGSLTLLYEITPSDGVAGDFFATEMAMTTGVLLVATPWKNSSTGKVYFYNVTSTSWTLVQGVTAPNASSGMLFGRSVDLSSTNAFIGAQKAKFGANTTGAVYWYALQNGTWTFKQMIGGSAGKSLSAIGYSVAQWNNTWLIIGSPDRAYSSLTTPGSVYVDLFSGEYYFVFIIYS